MSPAPRTLLPGSIRGRGRRQSRWHEGHAHLRQCRPCPGTAPVWHARSGAGPVRHTLFITNKSSQKVMIYAQESLDVHVAGPADDTRVSYINDDGSLPDPIGVYRDSSPPATTNSPHLRGTGFHSLRRRRWRRAGNCTPAGEWSVGRIAIAADNSPNSALLKAGSGDNFKTDLDPGQTFEVPSGVRPRGQGRPRRCRQQPSQVSVQPFDACRFEE